MSLALALSRIAAVRPRRRSSFARLFRRRRDRASAPDVAPDPRLNTEAIIQICYSRTYGIRGLVAVHCWVLYKRAGAPLWDRLEAIGVREGQPSVRRNFRPPRFRWGGNRPRILIELRGATAERALTKLEAELLRYPHERHYWGWPGPNCNSFVAALIRAIPELRCEMPALALGKDFLPGGRLVARAPSNTGLQVSLWGLLGVTLARAEGLELNLAGFVLGVDPLDLAIKLPGIGRLGWR